MSERSLVFGTDAAAYHRFRPGYPDSIVGLVTAHAEGAVDRALEIGAGTGKATLVFAGVGIEVVAVEPDARMSAELHNHADGLPITIITSTFEEIDPAVVGTFDLVYAAAAFHWTDPGSRWDRTAELLRPGGVVAILGAAYDIADEELSRHVDDIADNMLGADSLTIDGWPAAELGERPEFGDIVETTVAVRMQGSAADFVSHLATVSRFKVLAEEQRVSVLARIRAALPDTIDVSQDSRVTMARRLTS
jgi:SAM-dependent methyltransferase